MKTIPKELFGGIEGRHMEYWETEERLSLFRASRQSKIVSRTTSRTLSLVSGGSFFSAGKRRFEYYKGNGRCSKYGRAETMSFWACSRYHAPLVLVSDAEPVGHVLGNFSSFAAQKVLSKAENGERARIFG